MLNGVYILILTTCQFQMFPSVAELGIDLKGTIFQDKGKTVYMFFCSTNETFLRCTVEFLLDNTTFDDIRYEDNHCYHKGGICDPKRCTCSRDCTLFMWTFLSNTSEMNHTFGCQSRLSAESYIYKANIYIKLSKGEFVTINRKINSITRQSTNEHQTSQEPRLLEQKQKDPKDWINIVTGLVTGTGIIIIIIILLVNKCNCSKDQRKTQAKTASNAGMRLPIVNATCATDTNLNEADTNLNEGMRLPIVNATCAMDTNLNEVNQQSTVDDSDTASNEEKPQSTVDDSDAASNEETKPLINGASVIDLRSGHTFTENEMAPINFVQGTTLTDYGVESSSLHNESEV